MTSGQNDAARGLAFSDNMAGGWGREKAMLPDHQLLDAICRTDLGDQLGDFWIPESPIAANDQESACATRFISLQLKTRLQRMQPSLPSAPSGIDRRMLVMNASL
jgi:hypothetical protein